MVVSIDHLVFVWCLLVLGCCLVVVWFVYCDCLGFAVCVWLVGYLGWVYCLLCWVGFTSCLFVGLDGLDRLRVVLSVEGFGGSLLLGWFECVV